jgi:tetratricopeptide (TPR) repeat protein
MPPISDPVLAGHVAYAIQIMLYVNIIWSFVNLLPLWPLDGGQLFRLGLLQLTNPRRAERITHFVSLSLLAVALVAGLIMQSIFIVALAAFAAWRNVQALRGQVSSGAVRPVSQLAKKLVAEAEAAYAAGDFQEAARLCHQLRSLDNPATSTMEKTWQILGPATARLGEHDNALRFLKRAKPTPDVVEALVECYFQLDMNEELGALIASKDFQKLPAARRDEIRRVVEP